jgi:hypothetical protein
MIWALITMPDGANTVPAFGDPFKIGSILMTGYSIHMFFAQNIIKNPDRKSYPKILIYSFIFGGLIYTFVSYGSFGSNKLI